MTESSDRDELKKRLEQAKRIAGSALDPLTKERLHTFGARVGRAAAVVGTVTGESGIPVPLCRRQ